METINIDENQNDLEDIKIEQSDLPDEPENPKPKGKFKQLFAWMRAHKIKTALIALVFLAACSVAGYFYWKNHQPINQPGKYNGKVKTTVPSPLTGVEVSKEDAKRPVTGIMIENSPEARPQSGLQAAGIVFEAVAEGGITRFLALFQEARPTIVGPVRSVRPYYADWAAGFDASFAHVGGSADGIARIGSNGLVDLDQFRYGGSYWRATDRYAPHNVYTNFDRMDALNKQLGKTGSKFTPYERKKDTPVVPPTATTLNFDFSGPLFAVQWRYDQPTNSYLRFLAGAPHVDRETNKQLSSKNVVLINMPTTYSGQYAVMPSVGSGTAVVFRDGTAIKGTWNKPAAKEQLQLKDEAGKPIPLNKGNTWFEIVPAGRAVTY